MLEILKDAIRLTFWNPDIEWERRCLCFVLTIGTDLCALYILNASHLAVMSKNFFGLTNWFRVRLGCFCSGNVQPSAFHVCNLLCILISSVLLNLYSASQVKTQAQAARFCRCNQEAMVLLFSSVEDRWEISAYCPHQLEDCPTLLPSMLLIKKL